MFKGKRLSSFRALFTIPAIFSSLFLFVSADVHFLPPDGQAKLLKLLHHKNSVASVCEELYRAAAF
jgi:hypothetical protein